MWFLLYLIKCITIISIISVYGVGVEETVNQLTYPNKIPQTASTSIRSCTLENLGRLVHTFEVCVIISSTWQHCWLLIKYLYKLFHYYQ